VRAEILCLCGYVLLVASDECSFVSIDSQQVACHLPRYGEDGLDVSTSAASAEFSTCTPSTPHFSDLYIQTSGKMESSLLAFHPSFGKRQMP